MIVLQAIGGSTNGLHPPSQAAHGEVCFSDPIDELGCDIPALGLCHPAAL